MIHGFFGYHNLSKPRTYNLKPGECSATLNDGRLLVVHPDRAPKVVHHDGTETVLVGHDLSEPPIEKRN